MLKQKFTANVVVGPLGNENPDLNRFILVTPKSENDVRLQATLDNQNPTGKPVGAVSKQNWLYENLADIVDKFKVVSFDNLAIEQLNVRRLMTDEEWNEFYMGDDGTMTYYIDMVEHKFARSSTAAFDKRYNLLDSVDDMFQKIVSEREL